MSDIVIKAENIGKLYKLGEIGTGTISHDLNRWWARVRGKEDPFAKLGQINDCTTKGSGDYVWALKDINFEVRQGEVLGIIGRNGAGKSTLLKILSKVTTPTTGRISVKGRIASLLEVGTGFHPELTGRENIFLNGAILGMSRSEVRAKFDEIVDFAGVERYIDTPVKRYSSGMYVRLAFAVAAFLEPEILIVDEVLAVGDAEFQRKCLGRMKDVSVKEGRTILFVSHNMSAVRSLCTKALLMKNGIIEIYDSVNNIIKTYENTSKVQVDWRGHDGDDGVIIQQTLIKSDSGLEQLYNDDDIKVELLLKLNQDFRELVVGFNLRSSFGYPLARVLFNDYIDFLYFDKGVYRFNYLIPKHTLAVGSYEICFDVAIPFVKKVNSSEINLSFDILFRGGMGNRFLIEGDPNYNSVVRPNWFNGINKIK